IPLQKRTREKIGCPASMDVPIALRPHVEGFMARGGGSHGTFIGVNVEDFGPRSLFRLAHADGLARYQLRHFAVRIVQIAGDKGALRANCCAGRFQSYFDAVRAEMAFGRGVPVGVNINGIIRPSLHAGLAPDAAGGVEIYNPVSALVHGGYRTDFDAWRFLAVTAAGHLEDTPRVRELPLLHILDPRPVDAQRNLVLDFACHRAGMTADALAAVDDDSVSHAVASPNRAVTRAATAAPSIMQLRIGFMPVAHPARKTPSRVASCGCRNHSRHRKNPSGPQVIPRQRANSLTPSHGLIPVDSETKSNSPVKGRFSSVFSARTEIDASGSCRHMETRPRM